MVGPIEQPVWATAGILRLSYPLGPGDSIAADPQKRCVRKNGARQDLALAF